jgi:hypothetical protein
MVDITLVEHLYNDLSGGAKDVLNQLVKVTWDGNISSKVGRDELINKGLATRFEGFTVLSDSGLRVLQILGKLERLTQ